MAAAQDRPAPAIAAIDAATDLQKTADGTEATAWAQVEAQDAKSDAAIGSIRDAMWNAVGRPRQSPNMDQVFPRAFPPLVVIPAGPSRGYSADDAAVGTRGAADVLARFHR